jgi:hypothetical protein
MNSLQLIKKLARDGQRSLRSKATRVTDSLNWRHQVARPMKSEPCRSTHGMDSVGEISIVDVARSGLHSRGELAIYQFNSRLQLRWTAVKVRGSGCDVAMPCQCLEQVNCCALVGQGGQEAAAAAVT